jgi:hypothetical protein
MAYLHISPLGGSCDEIWRRQEVSKRSVCWNFPKLSQLWRCNGGFGPSTTQNHLGIEQFVSGTRNSSRMAAKRTDLPGPSAETADRVWEVVPGALRSQHIARAGNFGCLSQICGRSPATHPFWRPCWPQCRSSRLLDWVTFWPWLSSSFLASTVTWPNRRDLFLWGYIKDPVHVSPVPRDLPQLRKRTVEAVAAINREMCGRNLLTDLTSAASPRVGMWSTSRVGQILESVSPFVDVLPFPRRDHPGYCNAEFWNPGGIYELPSI